MFRSTVISLLLLGPLLAVAQPVKLQLTSKVRQGERPKITVVALEPVVGLELELRSDEGAGVAERRASLERGCSWTVLLGGRPGRTHYEGTIRLRGLRGEPWENQVKVDVVVEGELKATYRRDHLDLERRRLELQLSERAGRGELTVIGEGGRPIGRGEAEWHGEPPGTWLPITWTQEAGEVLRLDLRLTSAEGFATRLELSPWAVAIPHEEVNFATGSAAIEVSEQPKLDSARARIAAAAAKASSYVKVQLYIAGHTDSLGSRESNRRLSLDRARSIGRYFRQHGVGFPVLYEGFGEERLKVATPDETDERNNRRADYILGAEPPVAYPGVAWKRIE